MNCAQSCTPLLPPAATCSQWSWPINLPVQFFGIFPTGVLRSDATDTPWAGEIEQKVGARVCKGRKVPPRSGRTLVPHVNRKTSPPAKLLGCN